jgi:hypothetical protein
MLIVSRNGKTTVVSGWRAWLVWAVLCIVASVFIVLAGALALGFALTLAAFLLFVVPLAVAIALITTWIRGLR